MCLKLWWKSTYALTLLLDAFYRWDLIVYILRGLTTSIKLMNTTESDTMNNISTDLIPQTIEYIENCFDNISCDFSIIISYPN